MTKQLEILAQQDARLSLTIDLEPGESLIGRAVRLMVRKFPGDSVVQLVASSTDERLLVTGDRRLQLEIPSSVMAALDVREPVELWTHNIQSWTDEDDKDRESEGVFRVSRATARDTEVEPAPTVAGFVSATVPQTWTPDQQQIARTNLGIVETVPPGGGEGVSDHGALTGLADDDHPQYHNDARGDARYSQLGHTHSYEASGAAAAAIAAHEAAADPHPTYTTAAEAAAAAPVQSVAGRTGAVTLSTSDVSGLGGAATLNVGTSAGTVAAGDDSRLSDARAPTSHNHALGDIDQSGATSGQVPTWNGSAWVPQTPSGASPGGSGSELQYRGGASTFGGASGTHWDAVNGRLSIGAGTSPAGMLHAQASAAAVIPAVLQGAASQTAALQEWRTSAGSVVGSVSANGGITVSNTNGTSTYASLYSTNSVAGCAFKVSNGTTGFFQFQDGYGYRFAGGTNNEQYLHQGLQIGASATFRWTNVTSGFTGSGDTALVRAAAGIIGITNASTGGGSLELIEVTAPSAPGANKVRIYAEDNGSGKTRLMALFPSGAAQQIAIEP